MSAYITRTINTYKATSVVPNAETRTFDETGSIEYPATNESLTTARAALREAGIECPRGSIINVELVSTEYRRMSLVDFLEHSEIVDSPEVDE